MERHINWLASESLVIQLDFNPVRFKQGIHFINTPARQEELAKRDVQAISTEQLVRLAALLRSEIHRATSQPDFDHDPFPVTNPPPKP